MRACKALSRLFFWSSILGSLGLPLISFAGVPSWESLLEATRSESPATSPACQELRELARQVSSLFEHGCGPSGPWSGGTRNNPRLANLSAEERQTLRNLDQLRARLRRRGLARLVGSSTLTTVGPLALPATTAAGIPLTFEVTSALAPYIGTGAAAAVGTVLMGGSFIAAIGGVAVALAHGEGVERSVDAVSNLVEECFSRTVAERRGVPVTQASLNETRQDLIEALGPLHPEFRPQRARRGVFARAADRLREAVAGPPPSCPRVRVAADAAAAPQPAGVRAVAGVEQPGPASQPVAQPVAQPAVQPGAQAGGRAQNRVVSPAATLTVQPPAPAPYLTEEQLQARYEICRSMHCLHYRVEGRDFIDVFANNNVSEIPNLTMNLQGQVVSHLGQLVMPPGELPAVSDLVGVRAMPPAGVRPFFQLSEPLMAPAM